jgi:uncharacterized membrane protein YqjE
MEYQNKPLDASSLSLVINEVKSALLSVVRDDLNLAKIEFKETLGQAKAHGVQAVAFGVMALLSVPPFMAFLVIGLGEILGGMYWLSALIVSLVFAGVGGAMAYRAVNKLKENDFSFPHTRRALEMEVATVNRKVKDLKEVGKHYTDAGRVA